MSRVALIGENSIEYVNALLDIWNNGDCAVLIDWRIPVATMFQMMQEAFVTKCYIEKSHFDKLPNRFANNVTFIVYVSSYNTAALLPGDIYNKFHPNYCDKEAVVFYSSGTTGESKGIILSHYAINTNADAIIDYMNIKSDDCLYIIKSLSHSSTLTGELLVGLKMRAKLVISPTITIPRSIVSNIEFFGVTIICLNPTLLDFLVKELKNKMHVFSLKTVYVSGSILSDALYSESHRVLKGINLFNVYGLSEAGPRVAAQTKIHCNNSVGCAIKGVEIAIFNEALRPLINGEIGVIHIKTKSLYTKYISGNEKRKALVEGWFNTGDYGFFDDNAELHVIGRTDDLIVIDAHKIYPSTIEQVIMKSGLVEECVVFKLEKNHKICIGCLYVGNCDVSIALRNYLQEILMSYEIPTIIQRSSFIPKTPTGKISRQKAISLICS